MAIGVRLKGKIVSLIEVTGRELSACILNDWLWQGGWEWDGVVEHKHC